MDATILIVIPVLLYYFWQSVRDAKEVDNQGETPEEQILRKNKKSN